MTLFQRLFASTLVLSLASLAPAADPAAPAPWSTYRANAQRTGCGDNAAGPAAGKVLWVHKSMEHFVAAPVATADRLYIAGLGGFNVPALHCMSVDPKIEQREIWTKSSPYLKLPTVSSPAIVGDKIVFGDGMHQTHGAALHCVTQGKALPLWQLPVPGQLVHLEGTPTVIGDKAYIGGGAAGVLCVKLDKVTLDGKEMTIEEVRKVLDAKWKELQAKYEADKKKDPDFAVMPNDDMLPKPSPVLVWQQGKGKWHVDAPVAVVGNKVLVASAFLDKEKEGDRALYCLDAETGKEVWKKQLKLNPWGGPSVSGDMVVISGSTIGYDTNALKLGRGFVAGYALADGTEKWSKDIPGGVLSCVALADGKAVFTATDGKLRAYNQADGKFLWSYDAKSPIFAAPAVAGGVAYLGDLSGVVHAVSLDGKPKWTLNLGTDPAVKAPGMVYGGPAVQGGRLYVATCNLEGAFARQPTVVVCIGEK
jgi:outer membrane protein assembly factor BamB